MNKVALIIIYNHQYNKNIEVLEEIYKERFSNIFHLIPFYNGEKENVIPVYENSFYFQGYVAQGFKSFFNKEFDHYFFVADDLVLNPIINERNYDEHLKLSNDACFLPELLAFHEIKDWWERTEEAFKYRIRVDGVEAENQILSYELAIKQFSHYGLQIQSLRFDQIYNKMERPKTLNYGQIIEYLKYRIKRFKNRNRAYNLSYPIVGSYSDIFVVSAENIKMFCHYCGVFAVTNLFVEVGLPTSMVLSAREIVTEEDLDLKGKALWTKDDYQILEKYNNNLDVLLKDFPKENLYLHPIKLSKWIKS
jgi:hypothetical protein